MTKDIRSTHHGERAESTTCYTTVYSNYVGDWADKVCITHGTNDMQVRMMLTHRQALELRDMLIDHLNLLAEDAEA